ATKVVGIGVSESGLFFSRAGWLDPRALCHSYLALAQSHFDQLYNKEAFTIRHDGSYWQILDIGGVEIARANKIILSCADQCGAFLGAQPLPLEKVRGQLLYLRPPESIASLKCIISYGGYTIPIDSENFLLGASYEHNTENESFSLERAREILHDLRRRIVSGQDLPDTVSDGRVCFRTTTPDNLPVIGPLQLHGSPSLYLSVAHGSRGVMTSAIAAKMIVGQLSGDESLQSKWNPLVSYERLARFSSLKLQ
ncbi:MAG: FAD-dependent oxidoreductase, partial [Bdellovibrionales bacterium]|nr:FAD-dependent oxidoreductase [Bdellovibrionales bacterium]